MIVKIDCENGAPICAVYTGADIAAKLARHGLPPASPEVDALLVVDGVNGGAAAVMGRRHMLELAGVLTGLARMVPAVVPAVASGSAVPS